MDDTSRRKSTDDTFDERSRAGTGHALGEDHVFTVPDRDGTERDIGRLVNALLTMQANERAKSDSEGSYTDLFARGVEVGMFVAVRELFGEDAGAAFRDYCNELERLLDQSDGLPS